LEWFKILLSGLTKMRKFKIFVCNVRLVQLYFWYDVVDDFIGGRNDGEFIFYPLPRTVYRGVISL